MGLQGTSLLHKGDEKLGYQSDFGLPRLMRIVGLQLASEVAMTGRRLSGQEALEYRLINRVAKSTESVVDECLDWRLASLAFLLMGSLSAVRG